MTPYRAKFYRNPSSSLHATYNDLDGVSQVISATGGVSKSFYSKKDLLFESIKCDAGAILLSEIVAPKYAMIRWGNEEHTNTWVDGNGNTVTEYYPQCQNFMTSNDAINWEGTMMYVDSSMANMIRLIAYGNNVFVVNYGNDLYRSTDYGLNWTKVTLPLNQGPYFIACGFGNGVFTFLTSYGEVFASTDNGLTWTNYEGTNNHEYSLDRWIKYEGNFNDMTFAGGKFVVVGYQNPYVGDTRDYSRVSYGKWSNDGLNWNRFPYVTASEGFHGEYVAGNNSVIGMIGHDKNYNYKIKLLYSGSTEWTDSYNIPWRSGISSVDRAKIFVCGDDKFLFLTKNNSSSLPPINRVSEWLMVANTNSDFSSSSDVWQTHSKVDTSGGAEVFTSICYGHGKFVGTHNWGGYENSDGFICPTFFSSVDSETWVPSNGPNMQGHCYNIISCETSSAYVPFTSSFPPPTNNTFWNATLVTGSIGQITSSNRGANQDPDDPPISSSSSVWFEWQPQVTASTNLTISTLSSSFDTLLYAYRLTGTASQANLTEIAFNDDYNGFTSRITASIEPDTTYYLCVAGYHNQMGDIFLNFSQTPPAPVNDLFVNATELTGSSGTISGTNANSTTDNLDDDYYTVWYKWTPTSDGVAFVSAKNSNFNCTLYGYSLAGEPIQSNLSYKTESLIANTKGGIAFAVTSGVTYYVCVAGGYEGLTGNVALDYNLLPAWPTSAVNNLFANKTTLSGNSGIVVGTNIGATKTAGDPGERSVWWKWTPTLDGQATINIDGSQDYMNLYAYHLVGTDSLANCTLVTSDTDPWDNTPVAVSFSVTANQSYYICVTGISVSYYGNIVLSYGVA